MHDVAVLMQARAFVDMVVILFHSGRSRFALSEVYRFVKTVSFLSDWICLEINAIEANVAAYAGVCRGRERPIIGTETAFGIAICGFFPRVRPQIVM